MDINDITYAINGAVFEVYRVLGSGFLEKVYEIELYEGNRDTSWAFSKFQAPESRY
jgi:hypothetical protein